MPVPGITLLAVAQLLKRSLSHSRSLTATETIPDHRLRIPNLTISNPLPQPPPRKPPSLDPLILHRLRLALRQPRRQKDRHLLRQKPRTRIKLRDLFPVLRAIPRLLRQLALGRFQHRF